MYFFPFKYCSIDDEKLESGAALTNLVQLCFGKPLDKSNQFSNWNNRPLREEQIKYAALDAYCLIEIYEMIRNRFMSMKNPFIDFNEFVHGFLFENKNKISVNKRNTQGTANGNIPNKPQMRTSMNIEHKQPHPHHHQHQHQQQKHQQPQQQQALGKQPSKSRPQYVRERNDVVPKHTI